MAAPRVFVSGYYGAQNLGDDLLLAASISGLRRVFGNPQFLIRDYGQTGDIRPIGDDVIFTGVETVWTQPRRFKILQFVAYLRSVASLVRKCNWVVFGGGTVFHANRGTRSLILQLIICLIAKLHGGRIAALGVGISGISSTFSRALLRAIITSCDLFLVRDDAAMRQCTGSKAKLTSDLAFTLADRLQIPDRDCNGTRQRTIAITVCPQAFDRQSRDWGIQTLCETSRILKAKGHRIVFIAMLRGNLLESDQAFIGSIVERLEATQDVEVRIPGPEPRDIERAFGDIDAVVGMRFHALVIAAIFSIPFVGIAHDNKILEISKSFGMRYFSLSELAPTALAEATNDALLGHIAPDALSSSIEKAEDNFRFLAAVAS